MNFYAIYSTGADRLKRKSLQGRNPAFIRINPALIKVILMRAFLIISIFTVGLLQVYADSYGQQVSLNVKNATIKSVIKQVKAQTGYSFLYTDEMLNNTQPVTVNLKNATIEETLQQIFNNQPLTFDIQDKTVILQRKQPILFEKRKNALNLNQIEVTGTIVDEQNRPIPGATVIVKGTNNATITDAKGVFHLKNVLDNATIVLSFIGYQKQELPAQADIGKIKLLIATNTLDAVRVIAYGQTTDRLSTGDITTITAKTIEEQPVDNPLLALEGRVPGMFITQDNGLPGSGVVVSIRGQNSISNGNDPLYVVDGVPYTSEFLPNLGANLLGQAGINQQGNVNGSPLSLINPSEIESISILKDAEATSIYGSRAANGAVLITTKKGKAGKTRIDVNAQDGWGQVPHVLDLLNTQQYLQMRHQAFNNDGITPNLYDAPDLVFWDTTRNTNWQKVLIGGTAHYSTINVNVSGGSTSMQYLVGATRQNQTTVFPGSSADDKVSLHFNISSASENQKFHFTLSGNYLIDDNRLPGSDLTNSAITLPPDAPPLYNKDGSINWAPNPSGFQSFTNPIAYLSQPFSSTTNNLVSNAALSYELLPGLDLKTSLGYTNMQQNQSLLSPLISQGPVTTWQYDTRTANYVNNNINSWDIEPQLTYVKTFGKGKLNVLLGMTINQINSNGETLNGSGYDSDLVMQDIQDAAKVTVGSETSSVYKYNAGFGRLGYTWNDEYLADISVRRDGSSRFGPESQFHDFGAVGLGWIFSQEMWIQNNLPFLSFGKVKGSYGTTGSDQIGNYQFLSLYNATSAAVPYQGAVGLQPNGLTNPYLQWEETKKLEFGLDLGFLKDRVLLNADYFRNRTSNELLAYNLPSITGFNFIAENFPATVQNSGLEVTINTVNIKSKDFSWTSSFNLTVPENKLVAFPNLATSSYASQLIIGQPITVRKVFNFEGVDPATGLYEFSSAAGGITSNPIGGTDNTTLVNTAPKFYGGLQNSFRYKSFTLDFLFQFVKQTGLNYIFGDYPGGLGNEPVYALNAWQKPGDVTSVQRYDGNYSSSQQWNDATNSNAIYSDASYIRLKNVSLSWQLPSAWANKALLQNASIYIQGQNILTFTEYKGLDPESGSGSLPPLRVVTMGVRIGL